MRRFPMPCVAGRLSYRGPPTWRDDFLRGCSSARSPAYRDLPPLPRARASKLGRREPKIAVHDKHMGRERALGTRCPSCWDARCGDQKTYPRRASHATKRTMDDPPGFQEAAQQGAMARVGSRIGDYAITGIISEDETGVLYGGRHVAKARPVALKLLHERYTRDKATSEQLLAEAKATQPIRHGNVMDIADLGVTPDGDIFLEMDYLDGESLRSRLHQVQRLPPFEAINILRQTARGLGAAHAAGVVHGGLR